MVKQSHYRIGCDDHPGPARQGRCAVLGRCVLRDRCFRPGVPRCWRGETGRT